MLSFDYSAYHVARGWCTNVYDSFSIACFLLNCRYIPCRLATDRYNKHCHVCTCMFALVHVYIHVSVCNEQYPIHQAQH